MLNGTEIGEWNRKVVEDNREGIDDEEMKKIYEKHSEKIVLPVDFGIEVEGERIDVSVDELAKMSNPVIKDIGRETAKIYYGEISEADVAVINGPAGVFEEEEFSYGTFEVLRAVSNAGFSVVGGGHISSAARILGLDDRFDHISTGGGASIRFLSGEKLPALEVIRKYWQEKWSYMFRS